MRRLPSPEGRLARRAGRRRGRQRAQTAEEMPLPMITLAPFGVLGMQDTPEGSWVVTPSPGSDVVVMDQTSLRLIKVRPAQAGAASRAVYAWLGILNDVAFPSEVRHALWCTARAQHFVYQDKHCIHAVGPDFREMSRPESGELSKAFTEAISCMAETYRAVFVEFASSGLRRLRFAPISGGSFAGPFQADLPELTVAALRIALDHLRRRERRHLLQAEAIELCIGRVDEWDEFLAAWPVEDVLPAEDMAHARARQGGEGATAAPDSNRHLDILATPHLLPLVVPSRLLVPG